MQAEQNLSEKKEKEKIHPTLDVKETINTILNHSRKHDCALNK